MLSHNITRAPWKDISGFTKVGLIDLLKKLKKLAVAIFMKISKNLKRLLEAFTDFTTSFYFVRSYELAERRVFLFLSIRNLKESFCVEFTTQVSYSNVP